MKLDLSTPIANERLTEVLGSVGATPLLQGTIYIPVMQVLIAPAGQGENALTLWELTQKVFACKGGEVELTDDEVKILKTKLEQIAYPWMRVRILDLLK